MQKYVCEECGKEYECNLSWHSKHTCCRECYRLRKNRLQREKKDKERELRKLTELDYKERLKRVSRPQRRDRLVEVNELARGQHLTYGQLQGIRYLQKYPNITRRAN